MKQEIETIELYDVRSEIRKLSIESYVSMAEGSPKMIIQLILNDCYDSGILKDKEVISECEVDLSSVKE